NSRYSKDQIPTIFFNSHDMERSISRFNPKGDKAGIERSMATLLLTSYGVPFMYFGEEIGMKNLFCNDIKKMNDIQGITKYNLEINKGKSEKEALESANKSSRDKSRSPMQWDNSKYYGFSEVEPWINIDDKKDIETVEYCESSKESLLNLYRDLISLRYNNDCLLYGRYENISLEDDVLSFERKLKEQRIKVIINFSNSTYKEEAIGEILYGKTRNNKVVLLEPYEFTIISLKK
ncbi:alpha-amylase family glycosyl hydrolase, partial [uncultured Clostridium sp.]|uniref:alpha-amylase family glycosyl hydrolase n=1 Tax=uncultured Clostridium sp. TaxID=59620 RepID=UPI0025D31B92